MGCEFLVEGVNTLLFKLTGENGKSIGLAIDLVQIVYERVSELVPSRRRPIQRMMK